MKRLLSIILICALMGCTQTPVKTSTSSDSDTGSSSSTNKKAQITSVTKNDDHSVTLSWLTPADTSDPVSRYSVAYSLPNGTNGEINNIASSVTQYTTSPLLFNGFGDYTFKVTSFTDNGLSFQSDAFVYTLSGFKSYSATWDSFSGQNGGPSNFNGPTGIAIDQSKAVFSINQIYVADRKNHRVLRFDARSGSLIETFPPSPVYVNGAISGSDDENKFSYPTDVTVDNNARFWVVDNGNNRIVSRHATNDNDIWTFGNSSLTFTDFQSNPNQDLGIFYDPQAIAYFNSQIYVADNIPGRPRVQILSVNSSGTLQTGSSLEIVNSDFKYLTGVAAFSDGSNTHLYILDKGNNKVFHYVNNVLSDQTPSWGSEGTDVRQFKNPVGITIGPSGFVYVTDTGNNRVQVFNSAGSYRDSWGTKGTNNGQFDHPSGSTIAADGTMYIIETGNNRVQIFTNN